uniref:biotin transporter BioY n=1 Tax=uncultured Sharpea sp. TaxID=1112738 RepID=UPI00258CC40F
LAIYIIAMTFNKNQALIITLIYLFMGAIGLPVFASFSGGMDHLLGASGGFLLAFPIQAYITSLLVHKGDCGYFMYLTKTSLAHSLIICVLPFLAGDALKMLCTLTIVRSLKKAFVIRDVLLNE